MADQNLKFLSQFLLNNRMFKKIFFHSVVAGILAAIAGMIYNRIYFFATETDFSKILNPVSIISLSITVSVIASFSIFGREVAIVGIRPYFILKGRTKRTEIVKGKGEGMHLVIHQQDLCPIFTNAFIQA